MCIIIFLLSTIFIGTNLSSHSPSGINSRGAYIIDLNSTTEYQHHSTTFYGHEAGDYSGNSIASADINDDGIDDVMVGAYWADGPANGRLRCGEVYVFFGGSFNETVDLTSDADMIIYGANSNDRLGQAITTGDVNGDAIQDLIFSASSADGVGEARLGCGEVYVLFGNDTFPATLDLLTTAPDIIIYGPEENDSCGYSLATGNVIGDTIDDILIGAYWGDGLGNAKLACGEVYLVEGVASYPPIIDLAFQVPVTIYGVTAYDYCGNAVTSGDVNNDNFDDIIIGAYGADGPGEARTSCGEVYLVYGNTTLPQTIDLAVNSDMLIYGTKRGSFGSYLGISLSSGDLNYDNFDDIVMGAYYEYVNTVNLGAVHVIYGNGSLPSSRDLMNIPGDVVIYGSDSLDRAGTKVVAADYDGDSFDDIILSASYADGPGNSRSGCGEIYIINGSSTIPSVINLTESEVDVIIYGNEGGDYVGQSLAVGKIDNDNGYDILIGANWADGPNNAKTGCGEVYLILSSDKYSPKLKTEFLGLTNGDGPDSKLCYAEYKPYSFIRFGSWWREY